MEYNKNISFLQSRGWGEFQKSLGRKTWWIDGALVIEYDLPFGMSYLYCPHSDIVPDVKEIIGKHIFLKVEPLSVIPRDLIKSSKEWQPSKTIILDLEGVSLEKMHSKTRYNIRLAEKKGVVVKERKDIDIFLNLLKKTAERDKFHLHEDNYYQKMMEVLDVKMLVAEYQGEIIAAGLFHFKDKAIYLYGASDYKHRNLMASSLLQWKAILKAKELGCRQYDFWGIDEKKWPGVTRFKRGFGGKEVSYPGSFDLVLRPIWYKIYNLLRRLR
ncbi:lipid II:glycine glycyltransferase FemX [Patescibacteria group bacterium]